MLSSAGETDLNKDATSITPYLSNGGTNTNLRPYLYIQKELGGIL